MRNKQYQPDYGTSLATGIIQSINTGQTKPVLIGPPISGLNMRQKRSEIDMNESPYCLNARVRRDYIEPRSGLTLISSSFDNTIVYIREFATSGGTVFLIVMTTKSLYYSTDLSTFTRVPWYYTTGTVTVLGGSPTIVTGTGTLWLANARAGDRINIDGMGWAIILTVDSNTQLTLTTSYTACSGKTYNLDRYFGGASTDIPWAATIPDVDYFVFSNGVDPVLYVDSSCSIVTRLSTDCPTCKFGAVFADRLIIANLTNLGYRMQWSAAGSYTDWTGTGSGYKDWTEDPYDITGLSVMGGTLVVYKTYSINHTTRTGRADDPFDHTMKVPGIGCYMPGGLVSIGDADIFPGSDNFYLYDLRSVKSVGDKVKDYFLDTLNPASTDTAHALVIEEFDEVQFYYAASTDTAPKAALVYNYDLDCWASVWSFASAITASGYATQQTNVTWDTVTGTWDDHLEVWDSATLLSSQPLNMVSIGTSLYKQDINSLTDGGTAFTFEWDIKDLTSVDGIKEGSLYRVIVSYYAQTDGTITWELTTDGGQSWESSRSHTLSHTASRMYYAFFDYITTSQVVGGRLRCTGGARFQIVKVRLEGIESGDVLG